MSAERFVALLRAVNVADHGMVAMAALAISARRSALPKPRRCGRAGISTRSYPDGIGRSRLAIARIERRPVTRGTGRNRNTVQKLAAVTET